MQYKFTNVIPGNEYLRNLCEKAGLEFNPEYHILRLNQKIEAAEKITRNQQQAAATAPKPTSAPAAPPAYTGPNYTALSVAALNYYGKAGVREMLARVPSGRSVMDYVERKLFLDGVTVPGWDFSTLEAKLGRARPMFGFRRTEAALTRELSSKLK